MEKRALLAFVLSMIIITAWTLLFSPPPTQPPPKEEPLKGEQGIPSESKEVGLPSEGVTGPPASAEEPVQEAVRSIKVETPLYIAELGSKGAVLLSWKLKGYRESLSEDSPLVDLVRPAEGSGPALGLRIGDKIDPAVNSGHFRFDKEHILLDHPNTHATLKGVWSAGPGLFVSKEITFWGDRYCVDLSVKVCDSQGRAVADLLGLSWPHPAGAEAPKSAAFTGPVALSRNKYEEISDIGKFPAKGMDVKWAGFAFKYFLAAVVPLEEGKGLLYLKRQDGGVQMTVAQSQGDPGACSFNFRLYLGPKSADDLKKAEHDLAKALNFGFFDMVAQPLLGLLQFVNGYTHNYGIAVIVLTILIKLLFWPLTHKSYSSMKELQRVQPRIKQIRERFKDNKEELNREMMLLYKTHKVNPLGGCLPMLVQIPVFFALYKALMDSIELRHAPFILWVKDLSAPDYLLRFPPGVSLFGIEGIGPLPLLMGATMVIQQKMTPTTGDPTQAKIMMLMPIFFTFLFISFPSGLVLYWLFNNVLSIVQQIYINSRVE
jgi:YidC/Oxa1 family membrane protein insertase